MKKTFLKLEDGRVKIITETTVVTERVISKAEITLQINAMQAEITRLQAEIDEKIAELETAMLEANKK